MSDVEGGVLVIVGFIFFVIGAAIISVWRDWREAK